MLAFDEDERNESIKPFIFSIYTVDGFSNIIIIIIHDTPLITSTLYISDVHTSSGLHEKR